MPLDRPLTERVQAWLYTGPLGHLWSTVADIAVLWFRWIRSSRTAARRP